MLNCRSLFCLAIVNVILRIASLRFSRTRIGRGGWMKCRFSIGKGSSLGWNCVARGAGPLQIGNYCAIGEHVRFITSNHDSDRLSLNYLLQTRLTGQRFPSVKNGVKIGHDVWIGDGAMLLPGIVVGHGAIIGAGAVVTKNVEAFTVVAGNPARPIRKRFPPELIDRILRLAWWNWDDEKLRRHAHLFAMKCSENPHAFEAVEP